MLKRINSTDWIRVKNNIIAGLSSVTFMLGIFVGIYIVGRVDSSRLSDIRSMSFPRYSISLVLMFASYILISMLPDALPNKRKGANNQGNSSENGTD